jgi:hypothetical protein
MSLPDFSLSARRRRWWGGIFLLVALLSISTLTYAPQNSASQVRIQSQSVATADEAEWIGFWPYGPCRASAIDPARNIAVIGNGEALQVLDISNTASLSKIGEVRLPGSPQGIVLAANYAYLVTLSYLVAVDLADPNNPRVASSVFFSGNNFRSIAVAANCVYLAAESGLYIYDVSNPRQPVYQELYAHPTLQINDVALWGRYAVCLCTYWKFPEHQEWTYGVEVVDVSSPTAPVLVGTLDLGTDYVPEDVDVSATGYAYVCQSTQGMEAGRLTVVDVVTDPGHPSEVGRYDRADNGMAGLALAGNYAFLSLSWPRRLAVLNISSPQSPLLIGEIGVDNIGKMVISGNLLGVSEGGGGFSLYSVTNPVQPFRLANYDTPDTVSGRVKGVAARGDYVYMACNSDGLRTMDVSVPSDPKPASVTNYRGQSRGLAVSNGHVYSLDSTRLSIFEISSPGSPSRTAELDLPCPEPASTFYDYWGLAVRTPYAYVGGTNWGTNWGGNRAILLVIDVSDPFEPRLVGSYSCAHETRHCGTLALSGNYIYLGVEDFSQGADDRRAGLRVIDVSDPGNPKEVFAGISSISGSYGVSVVVGGKYAFFSGDMLRIFDLSNPAYPVLLVSYVLGCDGIALSGDYAYLNSDKLWIIDISDIYNPTGVFLRGEWAKGVAVSGNIAYVPGSLSIFKNDMAPDITITSPSGESTLLGSVPIEVQASHSSGIAQVDFYIDDTWKASDATAPYSYQWDTTPLDDGFHTIRVRAYNKNGKSSEFEKEVFTRLVYAPLNFDGEKVLNRSLSQAEYINVLTWRAHPSNVNVVKYELYQVEGRDRTLVANLSADTLQYWHRRVEKDKEYTYALIAVNNTGRESDAVSVTVK